LHPRDGEGARGRQRARSGHKGGAGKGGYFRGTTRWAGVPAGGPPGGGANPGYKRPGKAARCFPNAIRDPPGGESGRGQGPGRNRGAAARPQPTRTGGRRTRANGTSAPGCRGTFRGGTEVPPPGRCALRVAWPGPPRLTPGKKGCTGGRGAGQHPAPTGSPGTVRKSAIGGGRPGKHGPDEKKSAFPQRVPHPQRAPGRIFARGRRGAKGSAGEKPPGGGAGGGRLGGQSGSAPRGERGGPPMGDQVDLGGDEKAGFAGVTPIESPAGVAPTRGRTPGGRSGGKTECCWQGRRTRNHSAIQRRWWASQIRRLDQPALGSPRSPGSSLRPVVTGESQAGGAGGRRIGQWISRAGPPPAIFFSPGA